MQLKPLPKENKISAIGFAVADDHQLFSESLLNSYECASHRSAFGLLLSAKGRSEYYINGIKNRVEGNNSVCINHNSKLAIKAAKNTAPVLLYFRTGLPEQIYESVYKKEEYLLEPTTNPVTDFTYLERIHYKPYFRQSITSLIALGKSCSSFAALKADIMIRNLFENLLLENKQAHFLSQNLKAVKTSTRIEIYRRVSLVKEWLDENFTQNITLDEMAAIANMNSQHFLRMFKQVYQATPYQYIVELKFQKAKELLKDKSRSAIDVCNWVGYESIHSFSNQFKKRFGISPSQVSLQHYD